MCLWASYTKKIWGEKNFFASLKSLKKRVRSGSISQRCGSGSISQRCGSESAPKCHGSPTLLKGISAAATPAKKRAAPLLTPSPPPLLSSGSSSTEAGRNGAKVFCPKEEPAVAAASGLVAPKFKAGTGRHLSQSRRQCCGSGNCCLFYPCGIQNRFFSDFLHRTVGGFLHIGTRISIQFT
jgi:hypothetical protein